MTNTSTNLSQISISKYEARTTRVNVTPVGEPIFHESATHIEIEDEAAGEFLKISQCRGDAEQTVAFDKEEWPTVRKAIDDMFEVCRYYD